MNQREDSGNIFLNLSGSAYLKCPTCGEYADHKLRGDLRAGKESRKVYLSIYEPKSEGQQAPNHAMAARAPGEAPPPDESNMPPEQDSGEPLPF